MQCVKCGTDNPAQARFCLTCGEKLAEVCPQCGKNLPVGAKFCLECGAKVAIPATVQLGGSADLTVAIQRLIPKELAERLLATRGQVSTERRLVTILFCDVKGSTAMGESLDPEDMLDIMNGAFEFLIPPIYRQEGTLAQIMGDAILAFFGAPIAHEDDPERAIRAGLEITAEAQRYAEKIKEEQDIPGLGVRVGINTGRVVVGELGSDLRVEYTAVGDAINLAARMEQNAPVGGVLITHDTYRHVRGVFDVEAQPPLVVKGHAQPVQTYLVLRAKPRAFRLETRGVEGIETRTIGRDGDLQSLQNAYFDAAEGSETRVVIISGDAGVGKSRLLYEFLNWAELRSEQFWLFKGRARPETQAVPHALVRDLFANRFEILESDSAATALSKFRAGMAGFLEPDRADLVGHWAGFDFSSSPAVRNLLGSPEFAQLAEAYLLQYFRALTAQRPTVVALEDMHWADGSTLDWIDRLVTGIPAARLLLVCLARPALFERRPHWGEGRDAYLLLNLRPLSKRQSRALVADILQKAPTVPDELYDLIVENAEGNPFYIEELLKMLIEDGVILRGAEQWSVEISRLLGLRVPPTLTGVLQARLDSLPGHARDLLQRASVVGRTFWDGAVAALSTGERQATGAADTAAEVASLLDEVRERELIFRREHSSFACSQEYTFKHLILHDVTYETVLLRLRRVYHKQVAQWLEANASERVEEYAGLIAEHYERAGEANQAAQWLLRVTEAAELSGAWPEALAVGERALALLPEGAKATRAALLVRMGRGESQLSNQREARARLNAGLQLARDAGEPGTAAGALSALAFRAYVEGDYGALRPLASEALALARTAGSTVEEARALVILGTAALVHGHDPSLARSYQEQALALVRKAGEPGLAASILNNLGEVCRVQGDLSSAARFYEESLADSVRVGNSWATTVPLFNLGEVAAAQNDPARAARYYQEGLTVAQELGKGVGFLLGGLGYVAASAGDVTSARSRFEQALERGRIRGLLALVLYALVGYARLKTLNGELIGAAEWLGLALNHPSAETDVRGRADALLADLRAALPAAELEAALGRGAKLELDAVVGEILGETEDVRRNE